MCFRKCLSFNPIPTQGDEHMELSGQDRGERRGHETDVSGEHESGVETTTGGEVTDDVDVQSRRGGSRHQEPGSWQCLICNASCSIVGHLHNSQDCLEQLKSHPQYQMKGSQNDEVFITKFCLTQGVCPHDRCQDDHHSEIPPACIEWWKSHGWRLMGWRGNKENADSSTIREKIREFLKYHRKKSKSTRGQTQTTSGESTSSVDVQENKHRCSSCSYEGDLIQHVIASSHCRKAYVECFLTEDEVDVRKTVFYLGIVWGMCARPECGERTDFVYLGPHLKSSSECLEFYQNEGTYLSIPNWTEDISPAIVSKKIAQMKRQMTSAKEKERCCGNLMYKKELSQLLGHVCAMCGSMGPVIGEDFSLKGGWNGHAWICGNCSEESPEYDQVKQQLEDKVEKLKKAQSSPSSDIKVIRCSTTGLPIIAPARLTEESPSIDHFAPNLSTLVLVPYDASGLRAIKGWCDEAVEDKDALHDCTQELLRRPIITNFEATVSCLYRSLLASTRQHMGRIALGLSKVARGEILSHNPKRTSARKPSPNIEQTMGSAMRDRCGWSFHCEQEKVVESEARSTTNGQVKIHLRGTILKGVDDVELKRILLVGCQAFVNPNIKTAEDLVSDPNFEAFLISMAPIVLMYVRNKASLFVKHILSPNFENHDLQLSVDDCEMLVEIHGFVYAKEFNDVNKFLAANPEMMSRVEVIDHIQKEEHRLPTATLDWEKLAATYNLGEIQAKEIVQLVHRYQEGDVVSPLSMLNLWTPSEWQTTVEEKTLRARAEELSREREAGEDVADAIIEITLVLQQEGLFEEMVSEDVGSEVRQNIRKRLIELRPDLPSHSINALQWFHTLLVKTGAGNQWTLKRECGETLVKPYHPLFLDGLQQGVEVKIVIGTEYHEHERRSHLDQPLDANTRGSAWKKISILRFLHGMSMSEGFASQSTVSVIVGQEEELTFSQATEKDEECDEVYYNSLEEGFVVSNGDVRKQYPLRPACVEDMTFAQFIISYYRKQSHQQATYDPAKGVGADSDEPIVGGNSRLPLSMRLANGVIMKKRTGKSKPVLLLRPNHLDSYAERLLFGPWRSLDTLHQRLSDTERERLQQNRLELFPYAVFPSCTNAPEEPIS